MSAGGGEEPLKLDLRGCVLAFDEESWEESPTELYLLQEKLVVRIESAHALKGSKHRLTGSGCI